ncbi:MAG: hypothetical protein EA363_08545 [Balneolaceae bacterium]|nr:MAG: hypothetical protein EA363_08545 [Balneolaceae bacterium]
MKIKETLRNTDFPVIAIQLLIMATFGLASLSKWTGGGIPESFANQFGETWLSAWPGGLFLPFYTIVVTESLAFLLAAVSFIRAEWLKNRETTWLAGSLVLSLFIFVILGYGLRLTGQFGGAANAFFYFGTTLLALWYVDRNKSNRVGHD